MPVDDLEPGALEVGVPIGVGVPPCLRERPKAALLEAGPVLSDDLPFTEALERFERDLLRDLLKKHGGAVDSAAREAGMNVATLYRKIKRYGLKKEEYAD